MSTLLFLLFVGCLWKALWNESMDEIKRHTAQMEAEERERNKVPELTTDEAYDKLIALMNKIQAKNVIKEEGKK